MRRAGRLVAEAHQLVRSLIKPGIQTQELENAVAALFREHDAEPLFLNYPNVDPKGSSFPAVSCISVNDEVVHGVPGDYVLQEGDLVSFDTGCRIDGWCGDSAWTYAVGAISPVASRLMQVGEESLNVAIRELGRCKMWSEVAGAMEKVVLDAGFSAVKDFGGHGIGKEMHESPSVPHHVDQDTLREDFPLKPGLTLAIEPMVNVGGEEVCSTEDDWTIVTSDGELSVHFEHTVALMENGPEILTLLPKS